MDRVYKACIPKYRRALEELSKEFASIAFKTNWFKLRIAPLLQHAKRLDQLLHSPQFSGENARLRRGVVMFHSDLVYLRVNLKALKELQSKAARNQKTDEAKSKKKVFGSRR